MARHRRVRGRKCICVMLKATPVEGEKPRTHLAKQGKEHMVQGLESTTGRIMN